MFMVDRFPRSSILTCSWWIFHLPVVQFLTLLHGICLVLSVTSVMCFYCSVPQPLWQSI